METYQKGTIERMILEYIVGANQIAGAIFGAGLQFLHGTKKGWLSAVTIISATIFTSLFLLKPLMDYGAIAFDSPLRIVAYSASSLISVEIVGLLIRFLPKVARAKLINKLGVKDVDTE